jgi:crossover junction endodeoxyribonuclease RuvC
LVEQRDGAMRRLAMGVAAPTHADLGHRLAAIADAIEGLLERWRPDAIALERAFLGRNVSSALRLGEVRGAILAGAGRRGISVIDYPPATVKLAVAGHGGAAKDMVARGVGLALGGEPLPGDATDALAVAICHLRHSVFASRLLPSDAGASIERFGRRRLVRT